MDPHRVVKRCSHSEFEPCCWIGTQRSSWNLEDFFYWFFLFEWIYQLAQCRLWKRQRSDVNVVHPRLILLSFLPKLQISLVDLLACWCSSEDWWFWCQTWKVNRGFCGRLRQQVCLEVRRSLVFRGDWNLMEMSFLNLFEWIVKMFVLQWIFTRFLIVSLEAILSYLGKK